VSVRVCLVDSSTISLVGEINGGKTVTSDIVGGNFNLAACSCELLIRVSVSIFEDHILGDGGDVNFRDQITYIGSHVFSFNDLVVRANCHLVDNRRGLKGLVEGNASCGVLLLFS